jgi:hypothetical protein
MYDKKVTPLQEYHTDGVQVSATANSEIPQSPPAIAVAADRKKTYSFVKDWAKMFKKPDQG